MPRPTSHRVWEVIGGEGKGGVLVRTGLELSSDKTEARLSTGAEVKEITLIGERLQYELIAGTGTGPTSGWVSIRLNHKELMECRGERTFPSSAPSLSTNEPRESKVENRCGGKESEDRELQQHGCDCQSHESRARATPSQQATLNRQVAAAELPSRVQAEAAGRVDDSSPDTKIPHQELKEERLEQEAVKPPEQRGGANPGQTADVAELLQRRLKQDLAAGVIVSQQRLEHKAELAEHTVELAEHKTELAECKAELAEHNAELAAQGTEPEKKVREQQEPGQDDEDSADTTASVSADTTASVDSSVPTLDSSADATCPSGRLWQVVGGEDKGGILVREGEELSSDKEDDRLATGSLLWELKFVFDSERLQYELMMGTGPPCGWVSIRLFHKDLVVPFLSGITREEALECVEAEKDRKKKEEEERKAREEAIARQQQEEADRRAKEAAERMAKEMALYKSREVAAAQEEARRKQREQARRAAEEAKERQLQEVQCKEWDRTELDKLEVAFALQRSSSESMVDPSAKGQQDLLTLKRLLIKGLRQEEDELLGAWRLPFEEEQLLAVAERIFELEGMRDLVFAHISSEQGQRQALGELISQKVGSVSKLSRFAPGKGASASLDSLVAASRQRLAHGIRLCELASFGSSPVLATAPHNAFLLRDGQPPHQLEQFTSLIAQQLAHELEGTALCWTRQVQWRTAFRFSLGVRHKKSGKANAIVEVLDEAYRDPNYLHVGELSSSPWFSNMQGWVSKHQRGSAVFVPLLHVDIHGCQDPPMWPTHAILGLGAMRQRLEELPKDSSSQKLLLQRLEVFSAEVEPAVGQVLSPLLGVPPEEAVSLRGLVAAVTETGERAETLSGAWPPCTGRLTQTQQSVSHAGISHAVQLELSLTLRRALVREPWAIGRLARALRSSWYHAVQAESETAT